jgi:hypothetical protein
MACNWKLRYPTTCAYCQTAIRKGTPVNRHPETGRFACRKCDKLLSKGIQPTVIQSPAQSLVDLARTAVTQSELDEIVQQLRTEFAGERVAQQFIAELRGLRANESFICLALRHGGRCNGCTTKLDTGTMAVWDKHAHRIWCLECASG